MFQVSTYQAEAGNGRAEVWAAKEGHLIQYYDSEGRKFHEEEFKGQTLAQVESIAENWTLGHHTLYG